MNIRFAGTRTPALWDLLDQTYANAIGGDTVLRNSFKPEDILKNSVRTLEYREDRDGPPGLQGITPIPNYDPDQDRSVWQLL